MDANGCSNGGSGGRTGIHMNVQNGGDTFTNLFPFSNNVAISRHCWFCPFEPSSGTVGNFSDDSRGKHVILICLYLCFVADCCFLMYSKQ